MLGAMISARPICQLFEQLFDREVAAFVDGGHQMAVLEVVSILCFCLRNAVRIE